MNYRATRLAEVIKKELSHMFQKDLKDPRVDFATITSVEVSGDLRVAKIYVSTIKEKNSPAELMDGLEQASGFIRKELGKRINLRYIPEIRFSYDTSMEKGDRIFNLLKKLKDEGDV